MLEKAACLRWKHGGLKIMVIIAKNSEKKLADCMPNTPFDRPYPDDMQGDQSVFDSS